MKDINEKVIDMLRYLEKSKLISIGQVTDHQLLVAISEAMKVVGLRFLSYYVEGNDHDRHGSGNR